MSNGRVVSIYLGPDSGGPMRSVDAVQVVPGRGIEGDRYWEEDAPASRPHDPAREITLIEAEALEALNRVDEVNLDPSECRRNVLTRGVALNHLVGVTFRVGDVRLRGIRLCEPCSHLEKLTRKGVLKGLVHRGGLRAQVVEAGRLSVGDAVVVETGNEAGT